MLLLLCRSVAVRWFILHFEKGLLHSCKSVRDSNSDPKGRVGQEWEIKVLFRNINCRKKYFIIFFSGTAIIGHIDMEKSLNMVHSVLFTSWPPGVELAQLIFQLLKLNSSLFFFSSSNQSDQVSDVAHGPLVYFTRHMIPQLLPL